MCIRDSGGFCGYEALQAKRNSGEKNQLVSLVLEDTDAQPLGFEPVYLGGEIIGTTSSCAYGYRVGKPVALALVNTTLSEADSVKVDIAGQLFSAKVKVSAMYDPQGLRMKPPTIA